MVHRRKYGLYGLRLKKGWETLSLLSRVMALNRGALKKLQVASNF